MSPGKSVAWLIGALISLADADDSLASRFSAEWKQLHAETERITTRLGELPTVPGDDLGSLQAFLYTFPNKQALETREVDLLIRITWDQLETIDMVALVPARKFDARGLDPNFGFPDDFSISLLDTDGNAITIASHQGTSAWLGHHGHPVVEALDPPIQASGIEIHVSRVQPIPEGAPELPLVALSEVFCFAGENNVAANGRVEIEGPSTKEHSDYWSPQLLHDGLTPLGLPEIPAIDSHLGHSPGWLSFGRTTADDTVRITLDLGETQTFNTFQLFPALRPSIEDFPGFGFPRRFRIQVSDNPDAFSTILDRTASSQSNPGHNPVRFEFPNANGRYVRIEATELWKPFPFYPAFLAFSEIQVLDGTRNLSGGATVIPSEQRNPVPAQGGRLWQPEGLTDGKGPGGILISRRTWLEMLDTRLELETRMLGIAGRMQVIESHWRRNTILTLATIGGLAICAVLYLPSRYRRRERNRIREIRERIAGDLHDDVGTNLGSIQMLSEMARSKPEPDEELETIRRVAAETVTSVRDIVWMLHPNPVDRVSTVDHLRETAAILLEPVAWSLKSDFKDWLLGDEDGRHLVLFFREALHNLRRHAEASEVTIHVGQDAKEFILIIKDDGRGITPETLDSPASLHALKQRAKNLGGAVEVHTVEGTGTTISLRFQPQAPGSAPQPVPHPGPTSLTR